MNNKFMHSCLLLVLIQQSNLKRLIKMRKDLVNPLGCGDGSKKHDNHRDVIFASSFGSFCGQPLGAHARFFDCVSYNAYNFFIGDHIP